MPKSLRPPLCRVVCPSLFFRLFAASCAQVSFFVSSPRREPKSLFPSLRHVVCPSLLFHLFAALCVQIFSYISSPRCILKSLRPSLRRVVCPSLFAHPFAVLCAQVSSSVFCLRCVPKLFLDTIAEDLTKSSCQDPTRPLRLCLFNAVCTQSMGMSLDSMRGFKSLDLFAAYVYNDCNVTP